MYVNEILNSSNIINILDIPIKLTYFKIDFHSDLDFLRKTHDVYSADQKTRTSCFFHLLCGFFLYIMSCVFMHVKQRNRVSQREFNTNKEQR